MFSRLYRHLLIAFQLVRIGIIRKSQFRVEFFTQVFMDIVWYSSHILVFEILYLHTDSIAGWDQKQMRVFIGFLFVSDAFMMTWLGQAWHFGADLKDGKLDSFRVKPCSTIFLYFFQRFSPEGFTNMLFAFSYLFYATTQITEFFAPRTLGILIWMTLLAWWGRSLITIFSTVVEFYIVNSDLGRFFSDFYMAAEDRPLDIFHARVRAFFIYVLPVGALSYIPAGLLVGKFNISYGIFLTFWLFILGNLMFRFWNFSFRKYESAMS